VCGICCTICKGPTASGRGSGAGPRAGDPDQHRYCRTPAKAGPCFRHQSGAGWHLRGTRHGRGLPIASAADTRKSTRKMKNSNLKTVAKPVTMKLKPRKAAMMAMARKSADQYFTAVLAMPGRTAEPSERPGLDRWS